MKVVVITRKLIDELERLMTNGATQFLSGESRRLMIELRRTLYIDPDLRPGDNRQA